MIAANFRKFPAALALQLPLPFGTVLKWATARPTTTVGRAIRAARARAFALKGRTQPPVKRSTPQWVKDARQRARSLAERVRALLMGLTYAA
jgi:hypothetical protein